ncbi:hypothetical protein BO82DRAFT_57424 [Aspergillus uvarum CBS 121591]|uniref:Uncharacterized protein n=1 Tax=Aspergillus uvarum CBS 121591 TaxID=1448315 RepID=A0A319CVD9_9EURO|nr:hypothetical protein BO82DRAFT_57424 [Aspergillus uvarum CBS 121591]PYH82823.1 hypothetical protein BO82DRAFT_57424 [Aspergillus uvarum CBS 121591]
MIRYKPTRITLGDGDLRYHLQRLLNRHSRLAEWHQHDQFLNDSSFDDGDDDAFLESDSDLFSAPSVSPPDSICYSAPDEDPGEGSSSRGRGGDHDTRSACSPEASTSPSSSTIDAGSPVNVQPSALSLEATRSAEKNVDVHSECRVSIDGYDKPLGGRNGEEFEHSPGYYDLSETSLSDCLTQLGAVLNSVRGDVTGETRSPRPCSQTPVSLNSCSLHHRSDLFSPVSLPAPLDSRAVLFTNLLTNLLLEKQPTQQSGMYKRTAICGSFRE